MRMRRLLAIGLLLFLVLNGLISLSACDRSSSIEWPDNLLLNPDAAQGTEYWVSFGEATVEENYGETPCFSLRNGGRFYQDVPIDREQGQYALLIGCIAAEYVSPDGAITDLPYLYGYMMDDQGIIDAYLQGPRMRGEGITANQWTTAWGVFDVPTETTALRFFLEQSSMLGVPYSGSAAYFDQLGLYHFESEPTALRFVDNYQAGCGTASRIDIIHENTLTILPNGSVTETDLVGTKRIQIRIEVGESRSVPNPPYVLYWSDSLDVDGFESASLVGGTDNRYTFDLPSSEGLGLCEWIKYRWIVGYRNTLLSTSEILIDEERYVMPTSYYVGCCTLQQALCLSPEE